MRLPLMTPQVARTLFVQSKYMNKLKINMDKRRELIVVDFCLLILQEARERKIPSITTKTVDRKGQR